MSEKRVHTFILRLSNEGAALSPELSLALSDTNLPYASMRFRPVTEIFWRISQYRYDGEKELVIIDEIDYAPEDITAFYSQSPKSRISRIEFTTLRWEELLPHLSSYQKAAFNHLIVQEEKEDSLHIIRRTSDWHEGQQNRVFQLEFNVPFSKARFVTGGVLINKKIDAHTIELFIENSFILKEFELLKEYFAKALEKTRFFVKATVTIKDGKIAEGLASSPDIARINETLLDAVRYLEAKSIRHGMPPMIDKELFSAEELYGREFPEETMQSGIQLLEILLRDEHIRNRQHILYLAGKLHLPGEKILFTSHPQFGFIFHVQGQAHRHFIWELLNSNATYIWTYDPTALSRQLALRQLEYTLSAIRTQGRQVYRFEMLSDMGVNELHFHAIRHDKVSSAVTDSFPLWRAQLLERLI